MLNRQTCKVCGQSDKFDFHVSNRTWKEIVPRPYWDKVVCLACFDNFAATANVNYQIQELYFAGDKAVFEFGIKLSVNL